VGNPKIALTLGTSNSGKSFLNGWILANLNRPFSVVIHTHADKSYTHHLRGQRVKYYLVGSPPPIIRPHFLQQARAKYRVCFFSLAGMTEEESQVFIDSVSKSLMTVTNAGLFIDEAHYFCTQGAVSLELKRLIRGARHYGLDVFLASHGLTDIDIRLRRTLQQLILFKLTEGRDLDTLRREVPFIPDIDRRVSSLEGRQFILVDRPGARIDPPAVLKV